jgi:hypothetical protein
MKVFYALLRIIVLTWVDFTAVRRPVNRRAVQVALEGESLEPVVWWCAGASLFRSCQEHGEGGKINMQCF